MSLPLLPLLPETDPPALPRQEEGEEEEEEGEEEEEPARRGKAAGMFTVKLGTGYRIGPRQRTVVCPAPPPLPPAAAAADAASGLVRAKKTFAAQGRDFKDWF